MQVQPGNGKYRVMAEINMIPLIDVALVLLIIFMVMTPYLAQSQIKIKLPPAKATEPSPPRDQMIEVQVEKNGVISLDGKAVRRDALESALKSKLLDPELQPLVIMADQDVPFQYVVVVVDAAKKLGVTKLGVSVQQLRGTKTPK
ncbi:MAG: biopolymer transporter ExbD [Lentisphaerae bacterium]|nr:biopolymer transporter ExbD [Lentisphaerota bacterium]